jgi:hypothetical protein
MTYNSDTKHGRVKTDTGFTYGGYSGTTTLHRRFVVKVTVQYSTKKTPPLEDKNYRRQCKMSSSKKIYL